MYKRSISNLAWGKEYDTEMYQFLSDNNFEGVEIAPSRIFGDNPYSMTNEARIFKNELINQYNLEISSMQSIWFGKNENIFRSSDERNRMFEYSKRAIEFANILNCNNLVFGCPKNRYIPDNMNKNSCHSVAIEFFNKIGDYAKTNNVIFSIEANPTFYNTNFINTTSEAIDLIKEIDNDGIKLNFDLGTVKINKESLDEFSSIIEYINHIHISEPELKEVKKDDYNSSFIAMVSKMNYNKYISLEMKTQEIEIVKNCAMLLKKGEQNG